MREQWEGEGEGEGEGERGRGREGERETRTLLVDRVVDGEDDGHVPLLGVEALGLCVCNRARVCVVQGWGENEEREIEEG
jgi:hypothetical protein